MFMGFVVQCVDGFHVMISFPIAYKLIDLHIFTCHHMP